MEVFVAFSENSDISLLEETMEAWDKVATAEPAMIQVPKKRFEIKRRVVADKLAKHPLYVLADLGYAPEHDGALLWVVKNVTAQDGMLGLDPLPDEEYPTGVRVIRKGLISKWPAQETGSYDNEHARAIRDEGYNVRICHGTGYKHLRVC